VIAYLFLYATAAFPALVESKARLLAFWILTWTVFVCFIGLRHQVGGDWAGYLLITEDIAASTLEESLTRQEALFALLTWISTRLGLGVYGANFFGAIIFCTGLFVYCASQRDRWLALATATPFLVVVVAMSANRQMIAIGIILFVIAKWNKFGVFQRSVGIAVAALFHASAASLLLLVVSDIKMGRVKKTVLIALASGFGLWLLVISEAAFQRYTSVYVDQPEGVDAPGAVFHVLLNAVPAVAMLWWRRTWSRLASDNWTLLYSMCWVALALLIIVPFFSVAASRISLYLFPISITFVPTVAQLLHRQIAKVLYRYIVILCFAGVLAAWLEFANTAFTYLPYQNVLTIESYELELPVWVNGSWL
jgi:EpsG family